MRLHDFKFLGGQFIRLEQDGVRNADLAHMLTCNLCQAWPFYCFSTFTNALGLMSYIFLTNIVCHH